MSFTNEQMLEDLISQKTQTNEFDGELFSRVLDGKFNDAQVAAALVILRLRPSLDFLGAAANEALKRAIKPPLLNFDVCDIVGTGGDGKHTINVSTTASIVASSLGFKIAKHGSVASSSKCGAADVLKELGINISLPVDRSVESLKQLGWCFLFAPEYHPSFKKTKPIRQALGIKTIFNALGPLINPMMPGNMVIGVYSESLLEPYAAALKSLGKKNAMIVHGSGLDEIALHGPTKVVELTAGKITSYTITPSDLGLKEAPFSAIQGAGPADNAREFAKILKGEGSSAQTDMIAATAGALLYISGGQGDLKASVAKAKQAILSKKAWDLFENIKEFSRGS